MFRDDLQLAHLTRYQPTNKLMKPLNELLLNQNG